MFFGELQRDLPEPIFAPGLGLDGLSLSKSRPVAHGDW